MDVENGMLVQALETTFPWAREDDAQRMGRWMALQHTWDGTRIPGVVVALWKLAELWKEIRTHKEWWDVWRNDEYDLGDTIG